MDISCYCINLRIITSFLRRTMGSLFSASICFCQNLLKHDIMIDQFQEEKIA